ncbi:MAG: ATP-binding protein [Pseudomonadota bacterium]
MPPDITERSCSTTAPPGLPGKWTGVEAKLVASNAKVSEFLSTLDQKLAPLSLDEDTLGSVQIVFGEVLNNIVEHAYNDAGCGDIVLCIGREADRIVVQVEDFGRAMPNGELPEKRQADLDVDIQLLPEGGFGWFLIHELVENLTYTRRDNRNLVSFEMCLVGNPQDEVA